MSEAATQPEMIWSVTSLANALGRSRQAVYKNWLSHDRWPFSENPPWRRDEIPKMKSWADDWLQTNDDAERADVKCDNSDGFWTRWMCDYAPAVELPDDDSDDIASYPDPFAGTFEREILTGTRTMNAGEVREYVATVCRNRARAAKDFLKYLPGWLMLRNEREITARIRAVLFWRFEHVIRAGRDLADAQDGIERDDNGNIIPKPKPRRRRPQKATT